MREVTSLKSNLSFFIEIIKVCRFLLSFRLILADSVRLNEYSEILKGGKSIMKRPVCSIKMELYQNKKLR